MAEILTREQAAALLEGTTPGTWRHPNKKIAHVVADDCVVHSIDLEVDWVATPLCRPRWIADAAIMAASKDLASSVVALHDRIAALTAERDDLAAELAAARGEDVGEWLCAGDFYELDNDGARPVVERHLDGVRWIPVVCDGLDREAWRGEPTGVLAAMRAACEAARGFGWAPKGAST